MKRTIQICSEQYLNNHNNVNTINQIYLTDGGKESGTLKRATIKKVNEVYDWQFRE